MSAQQTSLPTQLGANFSFEGFSFDGIANNFHFIRPWWLLAFGALFLLLFLLKKIRYYQSPWQHFLPAHLAHALLENSHTQTADNTSASKSYYWLKPLVIGSSIIVALAGPAWQKLPQPVYQLERGAVLVMDMSYSMYATDVKPNRLTRARYKAIDLLSKINEGDIGLVAYAGDAFIISPLTKDIKNIELLLPSLSPDIMPVHGANALAALTLADQTLKNAGHISGDIYWFTDDIESDEMADIYAWANDNNHKVNILGVGTKIGAPIRLNSGKLLKDNRGAIVIPKLPEARLAAIAKRSRGVYRTMTNDDSDITALTAHLNSHLDSQISKQEGLSKQLLQGDQYQEQGPWLIIIILPLLLSYFRRGSSILAISGLAPLTLLFGLGFSLATLSPNSYAADANAASIAAVKPPATIASNSASELWHSLWQTPDQQAQQHFEHKEYQQAAQQFEDSQWQGSAHYKAGEFEQALESFKQSDSAQSLYNQGNSYAQLKKIDEAIEAYKEALAKDPNLTDAKSNLAKLEALKKQQEQKQKQKQDSQDKSQQQKQGDDKKQGSQQQSQDQQQGDKNKQDSQQQSQDPSQDKSQGEQQQGKQEQNDQQGESKPQENPDQAKQKNEPDEESQDGKSSEQKKQQEQQGEQSAQAKQAEGEPQEGDEKSLAQQASDKKAQETQQKYQQLLNKVTDDPYLLLRNKMRLEYQKRRHEGARQGVTKKW